MRIHSWLSPKCVAAPSALAGRGVFAVADIAPGELVCVWGGLVVTAAELKAMRSANSLADDGCIAVHDGFWLSSVPGAGVDSTELFNHSCDANAGIKGQIVLVARRAIPEGGEVTFDYETAEVELPPFACRCGSAQCRGTIDGSAWTDAAFVERYEGYLSWYIEQMVNARRLGRTG